MSGLIENKEFSQTRSVHVINVELCSMVLLIDLLPVHITVSDFNHVSGSHSCQTVLTKNVMFIFDEVETFQDC